MGAGGSRTEATVPLEGWKQKRSGLWKSRPRGTFQPRIHRDTSLAERATFSMKVVHQAKAGRHNLHAPYPNLSPSKKGSARTALPNINKSPFSPKAKLEQQRPADGEDRAGGGTDESWSGSKGINQRGRRPVGVGDRSAEAGGAVIPSAQ